MSQVISLFCMEDEPGDFSVCSKYSSISPLEGSVAYVRSDAERAIEKFNGARFQLVVSEARYGIGGVPLERRKIHKEKLDFKLQS
ncbi:hypothetical protein V6N11_062411 [Hibiscus sabdariffa]|uniref:RRM domain-containing protein n=1 Tax=Hibiscus sabdariffa TaxID=183260 RepID=A0ABR2PT20_9ROSI